MIARSYAATYHMPVAVTRLANCIPGSGDVNWAAGHPRHGARADPRRAPGCFTRSTGCRKASTSTGRTRPTRTSLWPARWTTLRESWPGLERGLGRAAVGDLRGAAADRRSRAATWSRTSRAIPASPTARSTASTSTHGYPRGARLDPEAGPGQRPAGGVGDWYERRSPSRLAGFSTEAVQTPARVNVTCVTPLGEEVASTS